MKSLVSSQGNLFCVMREMKRLNPDFSRKSSLSFNSLDPFEENSETTWHNIHLSYQASPDVRLDVEWTKSAFDLEEILLEEEFDSEIGFPLIDRTSFFRCPFGSEFWRRASIVFATDCDEKLLEAHLEKSVPNLPPFVHYAHETDPSPNLQLKAVLEELPPLHSESETSENYQKAYLLALGQDLF
jgi:hypothetical protein